MLLLPAETDATCRGVEKPPVVAEKFVGKARLLPCICLGCSLLPAVSGALGLLLLLMSSSTEAADLRRQDHTRNCSVAAQAALCKRQANTAVHIASKQPAELTTTACKCFDEAHCYSKFQLKPATSVFSKLQRHCQLLPLTYCVHGQS